MKAANLHQVSVTRSINIGFREDAEVFHVNLNRFVERGDAASNPLLEDGDVVNFSDGGQVLILGEVRRPGSHTLCSGMDLLDILAEAGGGTGAADLQQSVLTRTGSDGVRREQIVDLEAAMAGKGSEIAEAYPDDVLYIPAQRQVILLGEVRSPGTYALQRDSSLVDVLGQVGGIGPNADPARISITRTAEGERFVFRADAQRPLRDEDGGDNPPLKGGDVIYVPEGQNHVLVLGEMRVPGTYTLREQADRILDVLAEAGGSTDRAALLQVTVTRQSEGDVQVEYFNVAEMQSSGSGQTERLFPGDVLFVPEGALQVLVLGQVQGPESYRLGDGMRLLDVLAEAGGKSSAAGSTVMLTRDENTEEINLGSLNRLGVGNRRLQAGDIVYVAEGKRQVLVLGEVRNPGYHILNFGGRVMDGIAQAGGLTDSAAADDVTLTREQSDGEPAIFSVDVRQVMENRYSEINIALEGGDVIIVPEINRGVLVLGEVRLPGYYLLSEGEKALDLVAKAGGMTARAQADAIRLNREEDEGEAVEHLNLTAVQEGTGGLNPLMRGGDVLYVPEARVQSLVFGEVRSPGYYPVAGTTRLLDLLARAGGLTEAADSSKATLTAEIDGERR